MVWDVWDGRTELTTRNRKDHMAPSNTIEQAPKTFFYGATDPNQLATRFMKRHCWDSHKHPALRFWRDEFWRCHGGRYIRISNPELEARVSEFIQQEFLRTKPTTKKGQVLQVTRSVV